MKNQYFGDINDYRKYGLLRLLSAEGEIRTGVCWMLTPSDGRTDGQFLRYLDQPVKWRSFDPELFDHLFRCLKTDGERDIRCIEDADILSNTLFLSRLLSDNMAERRKYFAEMLESFREADLIFFDPDNGLEVPSKPLGRSNSNKYLYLNEMSDTYFAGHSVLVYQHFSRENRDNFIERIAEKIRVRTKAARLYAFRTSHVVFFLASQDRHTDHFDSRTEQVSEIWGKQIQILRHSS